MDDFSENEIQEFITEAKDLLDTAEFELLNFEKTKSSSVYDAVFRALHSIKGGAGMLGLSVLQEHMHKTESAWGQFKNLTALSSELTQSFLSALDSARQIMDGKTCSFDYNLLDKDKRPEQISESLSKSAQPKTERPEKKTNRGLVYAIDDEIEILEVIKDSLDGDGFEVHYFTTAIDLFAAVKKQTPHVLITDYSMPQKTGLDILNDMRAINPDVPVIVMSGYLTKEILIDSLKHGGFYSALEKPASATDLVRECWSAYRHFEARKMLRRSINLLVYQFSDLEKYLIANNKKDIAATIAQELRDLLAQQRMLNFRSN